MKHYEKVMQHKSNQSERYLIFYVKKCINEVKFRLIRYSISRSEYIKIEK